MRLGRQLKIGAMLGTVVILMRSWTTIQMTLNFHLRRLSKGRELPMDGCAGKPKYARTLQSASRLPTYILSSSMSCWA